MAGFGQAFERGGDFAKTRARVKIRTEILYDVDAFKYLTKIAPTKQHQIVRTALRNTLKPIVSEMRDNPIPYSRGQRHVDIMRIKVKKGHELYPHHSRESAFITVKKSKFMPNAIFGQVELAHGLRWYQQILSSGFRPGVKGGGPTRVPPNPALSARAAKARNLTILVVPGKIQKNSRAAWQRGLRKSRLGRLRGVK